MKNKVAKLIMQFLELTRLEFETKNPGYNNNDVDRCFFQMFILLIKMDRTNKVSI